MVICSFRSIVLPRSPFRPTLVVSSSRRATRVHQMRIHVPLSRAPLSSHWASVFYACNPCKTTDCAFQIFRLSGSTITQYTYGSDGTCALNNQVTGVSSACGRCITTYNDVTNNYLKLQLNCPTIRTVSGSVYCATTCTGSSSTATVVLNQCANTCNPCNASQCSYQTFQLSGTGALTEFSYSSSACDPSTATPLVTYNCNTCTNFPGAKPALSVLTPCPVSDNTQILLDLSSPVILRAVVDTLNSLAALVNAVGVVSQISTPITVGNSLKTTLTLVFQSAPSPSTIAAISAAIKLEYIRRFSVFPVTRVRVDFTIVAGKREENALTNYNSNVFIDNASPAVSGSFLLVVMAAISSLVLLL